MPTYTNFVDLVRAWSNKDEAVVDNSKIQDAMRYAADNCYRKLRVAALEQSVTYSKTQLEAATTSASNAYTSKTELTIPADLVEFIQIREIDDDGRTCRVFNEKTDLRTFNDAWALKTQAFYWSRVGNIILLAPGFGQGSTLGSPTKVELHYYKRLPALDALYDVTPANFTAGYLTAANTDDSATYLYFVVGSSIAYSTHAEAVTADATKVTGLLSVTNGLTTRMELKTVSGALSTDMMLSGTGTVVKAGAPGDYPIGAPAYITSIVSQDLSANTAIVNVNQAQELATDAPVTFSNTSATKYTGNEAANWLRDENEKILLYGSLAEVFTYVQDDDQAAKYQKLFAMQIIELNDEDNKRSASGGNIQINYNGRGMI
tara:strand:- start:2431 stop:3555 length:1125 start_codon:yes stop_codon:yes gene_type:complete